MLHGLDRACFLADIQSTIHGCVVEAAVPNPNVFFAEYVSNYVFIHLLSRHKACAACIWLV